MELSEQIEKNLDALEELIPSVEIFKEIMVELIRSKEIDIPALQKEQSEYIEEQSGEFQLNVMLLSLVEKYQEFQTIRRIETYRVEDGTVVVFQGIADETGNRKVIRCSNVLVRVIGEEE